MLKINDPSEEISEMSGEWAIVDALMGGTTSMREAGTKYLPKFPGEDAASHADRLRTATLFPAYSRTVGVMSAKPFSKPLTFGDDVPARLLPWLDDVDQQGNNLHNFAFDVWAEALAYGLCGVLVDYPQAGNIVTKADEIAAGARPYFVHIKHDQILGWRSVMQNGARVLTQLRLAESVEVASGEWGTAKKKRVRVLEPGRWALYEEQTTATNARQDYALIDEGTTTLQKIPFAPFYGKKKGFMQGRPPLVELAHLNVQHWQDSSDQQKSVRFARVRIAALIGAEDLTTPIKIGADHFMQLPTGASIEIVQGSAESVKIGREELDALEGQMLQMGAELLTQKPDGQRTATEANNDAEANKSDLQRYSEGTADGFDQCLQFMSEWVGEKQGGHVTLFSDYGSGSLSDASAQLIVTMQQGGLISKATALREQQRRGMLSPDLVPEDELELVDGEGPALGTL